MSQIDNYGLGVETFRPNAGYSTWLTYCPDGMGPDPVFGTVFGPGNNEQKNGISRQVTAFGRGVNQGGTPTTAEKWGSFARILVRPPTAWQPEDARYGRTFLFGDKGCTSEKLRRFGTRWFLYASKVPFGDNLPPLP